MAVLGLIGAYWFWLGGRERSERRAFDNAGGAIEPNQRFVFSVDQTRFRKRSPGTEAAWIWELVPQVIEAGDGYLVIHSGMGEWLPVEGFASPAEATRFADLAARRALEWVYLRR